LMIVGDHFEAILWWPKVISGPHSVAQQGDEKQPQAELHACASSSVALLIHVLV
jgi:hypothetical protein